MRNLDAAWQSKRFGHATVKWIRELQLSYDLNIAQRKPDDIDKEAGKTPLGRP
jgi:hypothetical protein